jgi:hypothetical protein
MLTINNELVTAKQFAYDGCHKIYLIEDEDDYQEARGSYDVLPINLLRQKYDDSCELRFIYNWKLTKGYVEQFENAEIDY